MRTPEEIADQIISDHSFAADSDGATRTIGDEDRLLASIADALRTYADEQVKAERERCLTIKDGATGEIADKVLEWINIAIEGALRSERERWAKVVGAADAMREYAWRYADSNDIDEDSHPFNEALATYDAAKALAAKGAAR